MKSKRTDDFRHAAYARGLLDDSTFDAVRHFEEALGYDPFHLRANGSLLMELVLSGQFERAGRRAEFMAAAFPDEPVTPLARALMATLEEDRPARARHLAQLRRVIHDRERLAGIDAALTALDGIMDANHRMHGPKERPGWLARLTGLSEPLNWFAQFRAIEQELKWLALNGRLDGMRQGLVPLRAVVMPDIVGLGLPMIGRQARMVEETSRAYARFRAGDGAEAMALLEAAERKYPESLLRLIDATAHLEGAEALLRKGDLEGCFRESRRAHELAAEAADAPTLLPFGPYRRNAHWFCLLIEVSWGAQYRWDSVRAAVAGMSPGPADPLGATAAFAAGQDRLRTYPARKDRLHLLRVASDSRAYDEARSELLPKLLDYFDFDEARLLLGEWVANAPKDPVPYRLRARLEINRRNFREAVRWAEQGLAANPTDKELLQTRERAERACKQSGF